MDALAALGIVLPITLIIQAFANLIGLGGAPRAGIKMGEGNNAEAGGIFNTAFSLLVLIGVVIGAVSFVFARQIVLLFGCPPSAVEFAVSYLKNICMRYAVRHACTGAESVYSDSGIFACCNGICPARSGDKYCARPDIHIRARYGR